MKKVNFDNLTNIEVPDSLIKSALNVPNDNPKRPFLPVRFHRFAAGIAACVVIAAAVTLSLMFGFHNDVDLTNPDSDSGFVELLLCFPQSGCWPSCAFQAQSVSFKSVNTALKLEASGLHA